jgi:hypothetical protein
MILWIDAQISPAILGGFARRFAGEVMRILETTFESACELLDLKG